MIFLQLFGKTMINSKKVAALGQCLIIVPRTLDISPLFYLLFPNVLSGTLFGMSFWLPKIKHSQTWNILIELGKQRRFFFLLIGKE